MAIKPVLREKLQNSLHMLADYEHALAKLPKGSLIRKQVKGHAYYYLVFRDGAKVRFVYKGRLAPEEIQQHKEAQKQRATYRENISRLKRQITFLRSTLRGKKEI